MHAYHETIALHHVINQFSDLNNVLIQKRGVQLLRGSENALLLWNPNAHYSATFLAIETFS
jgi:hypothetical protein